MTKLILKFLLPIFLVCSNQANSEVFNYDSKYSSFNLEIFTNKLVKRNSKEYIEVQHYDSIHRIEIRRDKSTFNALGILVPINNLHKGSTWNDDGIYYTLDKIAKITYRGEELQFYHVNSVEKHKDKERRELSFIYTKEYGVIAYKSFEFLDGKEVEYSFFLVSNLGLGAVLSNEG